VAESRQCPFSSVQFSSVYLIPLRLSVKFWSVRKLWENFRLVSEFSSKRAKFWTERIPLWENLGAKFECSVVSSASWHKGQIASLRTWIKVRCRFKSQLYSLVQHNIAKLPRTRVYCRVTFVCHVGVCCDFAVTEILVCQSLGSLTMTNHRRPAELPLTGGEKTLKLQTLHWFMDPVLPQILRRLAVLISVRRMIIGNGCGAPSRPNVPQTVSLTTIVHIRRWTWMTPASMTLCRLMWPQASVAVRLLKRQRMWYRLSRPKLPAALQLLRMRAVSSLLHQNYLWVHPVSRLWFLHHERSLGCRHHVLVPRWRLARHAVRPASLTNSVMV